MSSMYRPPVDLLFQGRTFEEVKSTCCSQNLWLLVNLQSKTEFASHTLQNRDLWSDDTVSEAVMSSFVLWKVYDNTIEGKRISNLYEIDSAAPPVVLVIEPLTGENMGMWSGVIEPQSFVEDLSWFLEAGPHEYIEEEDPYWGEEFENVETWYPSNDDDDDDDDDDDPPLGPGERWVETPADLTEEPKDDCDKSLVCSLCIRFPDGRRKQRRFLKKEPFKLLWTLCYSLLEEWEIEFNKFKMALAIPGDSKSLDCEDYATFEESGLANSLISVLLK